MEPPARSFPGASDRGGRRVLRPFGKLDRSTGPALREAIGQSLSQGPKTLTIDLSRISFIDASGLGVLVYGSRAATAAHVKFVLSSPSPLTRQLLEPTRLRAL